MRAIVFAVGLMAAVAQAQEATIVPSEPVVSSYSQGWGVVGARTVGRGGNMIEGGLGWPGLHASFLHGVNDKLDVGGRFTFNYGYEGWVSSGVLPGIKLQFLLNLKFFDNQTASLGLHFAPGPLFYFFPASNFSGCFTDRFGNVTCTGGTNVASGFTVPVGLRLGIAASSAVNIGLSFDLPMWFTFGNRSSLQVPILVGAGAEYFLQSNLLLYFLTRMGPTVSSAGGSALFTFEGKLGVGYRF